MRWSCRALMTGPTSVVGSSPEPRRRRRARSTKRSMNALATPSWTITRLAAVQRWPDVPKPPQTAPSTARSSRASSITRITFFPPISSDTFLPSAAQIVATVRPTSVEPVDEVQHPARKPRLGEDLDEERGEERRVLRRLEDHGVAADERREDLPGRDRQREIPRRDRGHHADRHADRDAELLRQLAGRLDAEEPAAFAEHVLGGVDSLLHVAERLRQHLAHLARHEPAELVLPQPQ